jgi:hypothetical protein
MADDMTYRTIRIYALTEPDGQTVRYIGHTDQQLPDQLHHHLQVRGHSNRANWIRTILDRGELPRILLLEQVDGTNREGRRRQAHWIRKLRADGHNLVNP